MFTLCTYFDKNYLPQGLTLYNSLANQNDAFFLWILCLDESSFSIMKKLDLPHVKLLNEADLVKFEPELLVAKGNRPLVEYYYCFTANLVKYIFDRDKETGSVTYVDADMYFFSDISTAIVEDSAKDVMIIEHRQVRMYKYNHGNFNVCITYFKRSENGLDCLNWWAKATLKSTKLDNEVWGDQKYLDDFPVRFKGIYIIPDPGVGTAPWNVKMYKISKTAETVMIDDGPLKVYHFARFIMINDSLFIPIKRTFIDRNILDVIYLPYMMAMRESYLKAKKADKNYKIGYTLHNLRGLILGLTLGRCFTIYKNKLFRIGFHIPLGYEN